MAKSLKSLKDFVQESIDKGARSVEEVHQSIARLPLEVLQQFSPVKESVKKIADIQKQTIGTVYETIRQVNKSAGELAESILDRIEPKEKKEEK